jgi:hypothetical protein
LVFCIATPGLALTLFLMKRPIERSGLIALFFALIFQMSLSQSLVTGRVFDQQTGKHIKGATITKAGSDFKTTSNELGFFQVQLDDTTEFHVRCEGYVSMKFKVSDGKNFKIELKRPDFTQILPLGEGPTFPGGMEAFLKYIAKNISMPPGAPNGTIFVQMYLDDDGVVIKDSVKIVQGLCRQCDREALKVVKKSPKWNPGSNKNISMMIPIVIR